MRGLGSLSRRIDALQPQQEGGFWLVEDSVAGADEVKVENCTLGITGWYPRKEAIKMTKGHVCLWIGMYDGHRDEEERKKTPVKDLRYESGGVLTVRGGK